VPRPTFRRIFVDANLLGVSYVSISAFKNNCVNCMVLVMRSLLGATDGLSEIRSKSDRPVRRTVRASFCSWLRQTSSTTFSFQCPSHFRGFS
jgi:hypothetical protein